MPDNRGDLPEGLGTPADNPEYPTYSEANGTGQQRFSPASAAPSKAKRSWLNRASKEKKRSTASGSRHGSAPGSTGTSAASAPSASSSAQGSAAPASGASADDFYNAATRWSTPTDKGYQASGSSFGSSAAPQGTSPAPAGASPGAVGKDRGPWATPGSDPAGSSTFSPSTSGPGGTTKKMSVKGRLLLSAILVAVVVIVAVAWSLATNGDGIPGGANSPVQTPQPGGTVTPPAPDPTTFEEALSEFDEFTVTGTGDQTIRLPDGVVNGVLDIQVNGHGTFYVDAYSQSGDRAGSIVTHYGPGLRGTYTFGVTGYGDPPAYLEIDTDNPWQIIVRSIASLEELPEEISGDGTTAAVYLYSGDGDEVEIFMDAEADDYPYFKVTQADLIDYPVDITRLNRPSTVTTDLDPGPTVILVEPSGSSKWSLTKK